jgi:Coenzyme F420-reducing hydrogenase, beta subunit
MVPDHFGFLYPVIENELCIGCGRCADVCYRIEKPKAKRPFKTYAVSNRNEKRLFNSASGGLFAAIADYVFAMNGIVSGASWIRKNSYFLCEHVLVNQPEELPPLQGSKYVQSYIGDTFVKIENFLKQQVTVLFSGTPCQVAGLKAYLGKEYENLITADVICHGVPNNQMLADSVRYFEIQSDSVVEDLKFRDKATGWGLTGKIYCRETDGTSSSALYDAENSVYYALFLAGDTYRDSCYKCPWASLARSSDFTMGDFWGIETTEPNIILNAQRFNMSKGISCCLINTEKADKIMAELIGKGFVDARETTAEKIAASNRQLNEPSRYNKLKRSAVFFSYRLCGYGLLAVAFKVKQKLRQLKHRAGKVQNRE